MKKEIVSRIFKNMKTSSVGLAGAIVTICGLFGFGITQEVALSIVGVAILLMGLIVKDE